MSVMRGDLVKTSLSGKDKAHVWALMLVSYLASATVPMHEFC